LHYVHSPERLTYWRTYTGVEVDAVIGEARVAVEIKSTEEVRSANIRNLRIFADEFPGSRRILVSLDRFSRNIGEVECLYVYDFFHMLWSEGL